MASRIKGITVEIGGDTSGLEKSLSTVNNSIKKTQSQLRDVNNLLKLDPSNMDIGPTSCSRKPIRTPALTDTKTGENLTNA